MALGKGKKRGKNFNRSKERVVLGGKRKGLHWDPQEKEKKKKKKKTKKKKTKKKKKKKKQDGLEKFDDYGIGTGVFTIIGEAFNSSLFG